MSVKWCNREEEFILQGVQFIIVRQGRRKQTETKETETKQRENRVIKPEHNPKHKPVINQSAKDGKDQAWTRKQS